MRWWYSSLGGRLKIQECAGQTSEVEADPPPKRKPMSLCARLLTLFRSYWIWYLADDL
jgi:hypothetical protein